MDVKMREDIASKLEAKGSITIKDYTFSVKDGLIWASPQVRGFENPMTWDTFTHLCLNTL